MGGEKTARGSCASQGELVWDPGRLPSQKTVSYLDFFYTNTPKWDMQKALDHLHQSGYNDTIAKHTNSPKLSILEQRERTADNKHVWESDKFLNAMLDTNKDFDEMRRRFYPTLSVKELVSYYYKFKCTKKGRNWATMYKKTSTNEDDQELDYHDDVCRTCGKEGELLCCDTCEAAFHVTCLTAEQIPASEEETWCCPACELRFTTTAEKEQAFIEVRDKIQSLEQKKTAARNAQLQSRKRSYAGEMASPSKQIMPKLNGNLNLGSLTQHSQQQQPSSGFGRHSNGRSLPMERVPSTSRGARGGPGGVTANHAKIHDRIQRYYMRAFAGITLPKTIKVGTVELGVGYTESGFKSWVTERQGKMGNNGAPAAAGATGALVCTKTFAQLETTQVSLMKIPPQTTKDPLVLPIPFTHIPTNPSPHV